MEKVTRLDSEAACPFVGESLRQLRTYVGNQAAVLGFVGAPFTLATYIVEGGSSKGFAHIKKMAFSTPEVGRPAGARCWGGLPDREARNALLLLQRQLCVRQRGPASKWHEVLWSSSSHLKGHA